MRARRSQTVMRANNVTRKKASGAGVRSSAPAYPADPRQPAHVALLLPVITLIRLATCSGSSSSNLISRASSPVRSSWIVYPSSEGVSGNPLAATGAGADVLGKRAPTRLLGR